MAKDYYSILGLSKTASVEEIKKAYRKKALEFHPDKNREANAEERFKEIGEAYEILSDSDKRSMYDRCGQSGQRSANTVPSDFSFKSTVDPFDLFRTFFGSKDPFADVFASVFKNGEFCQEPRRSASSHRSNFVSQHFLKVNRSRLGSDDPSAKTTVEEQIGEGGTVHITKTIIGGDGSVRREMRFRTQSDSRVMSDRSRFGDSDKNIDRQVSAPAGYVTTSSPIIIKKVDIKRETVENQPIKVKEAETATATATIQIHPPPSAKTARIKINVVKQATENKENLIKNTDDKNDNKIKILDNNSKIHTENKITLTLPLKT